jgi:hypothetical protein
MPRRFAITNEPLLTLIASEVERVLVCFQGWAGGDGMELAMGEGGREGLHPTNVDTLLIKGCAYMG